MVNTKMSRMHVSWNNARTPNTVIQHKWKYICYTSWSFIYTIKARWNCASLYSTLNIISTNSNHISYTSPSTSDVSARDTLNIGQCEYTKQTNWLIYSKRRQCKGSWSNNNWHSGLVQWLLLLILNNRKRFLRTHFDGIYSMIYTLILMLNTYRNHQITFDNAVYLTK